MALGQGGVARGTVEPTAAWRQRGAALLEQRHDGGSAAGGEHP